jgi:anthranilate 1,2-dioxygenase large subunit
MSSVDAKAGDPRASLYESQEIYEREADAIFRGEFWHYLAFSRELTNVGDFVVTEVGPEPVVIDRAADGIHAFINRCAHQGARIVRNRSGSATRHVCELHRWAYDLSGTQIGATASSRCLPKLDVGMCLGLAFGSFRPAEDIWAYLGSSGFGALHDLCSRPTRSLGQGRCRINANWKRYVQALFDTDGYFGVLGGLRPGEIDFHGDRGHAVWSSPYERANGTTRAPLAHLEIDGGGAIVSFPEHHSSFQSLILYIYPSLVIARIANHMQLRLIIPQGPGSFDLSWINLGYEADTEEEGKVRREQGDLLGLNAPLAADDVDELERLQRSSRTYANEAGQAASFWERQRFTISPQGN